MNPIHQLFNEKFVISMFKKRVLPKYPDFIDIKKIEIKAHKDNIWEETYHVVLEFQTTFLTKDGRSQKLPIFCSAHSDEPRKNLYKALKYLWDNGFSKGNLTVPHPLFHSNTFKATFYRGAEGKNFYTYIQEDKRAEIKDLIVKTANWFAKLHNLPTTGTLNFNKKNSRIKTAIPGRDEIIALIGYRYSRHQETFKKFYEHFIEKEEVFLKSTEERWFIHGDAHPENVIKVGEKKVALIDFNDLSLSDFARDLGCFLQQFEYMAIRKIKDKEFTEDMKKLFLEVYLKARGIKMDKGLEERIDNYYNWTAIRTVIFFLLKSNPEPERSFPVMEEIRKKLNIR